jgi:fatty-acyl-CoA synthase
MYTEETFQNILDYWGREAPEREAVYDSCRRISYRELMEETQYLTSALSQLQIQKGDIVVTLIPNWYEFIEIFFALTKLGAILIPFDAHLEKSEVRDRLNRISPKAVFVADRTRLNWLMEVKATYQVITVRFEEKGFGSLLQMLERREKEKIEPVPINPNEDVCMVMFTSGSTGIPKGVELTYRNLFQSAQNIGNRLECTSQDSFIVPLPVCHLFAVVTGMLIPCYFGGKIILMDKFTPQKTLALIEQEKATVLYGVPTMFIRELQEYRQNKTDVSSLRTGIMAGAFCDENLIKQVRSELRCDIMVVYGSTESVGFLMTSFQDDDDKRSQTVGRTFEGIEIRVIDSKENPVEPGEIGELVCRGYNVMKGYYLDPEETGKTVSSDGWFHTGDLAICDPLGYIKIVGRKKDMIIRGGENIYPTDVEKIYYNHPDVLEISVLGIPHEDLGEQTCAVIRLKGGSQETEESLREYARGKIIKCKIPDYVAFVNKMPKLSNGKIDKNTLKSFILSLNFNNKRGGAKGIGS